MKKFIFIITYFLCTMLCDAQTNTANYNEIFRPQFHFSPPQNWMNDPNGLLFYNNQFHLFYQSNPFANVWGHMSWSHAISKDLLHWQNMPLAIKEENGIMIFSGTCAADINNTSGFGANGQKPLVAIYTGSTDTLQTQNAAYSLDNGITWKKYAHNPILDVHEKDFRDPNVFWCTEKKYWVMALVLSVEHKVEFYKSNNLLHWDLMSEFGPAGDTSGVWECPSLFKVNDEKNVFEKWALTLSVNGAIQYFIGSFDGEKFKNENTFDSILRPDYGPDYYAAINYNNLSDNKKPVMMGWINNWYYANDIPEKPWKGAMSLPRNISIEKAGDNYILIQKPINSIKTLRGNEINYPAKTLIDTAFELKEQSNQFEMDVNINCSSKSNAGIQLAVGNGHFASVGYDNEKHVLYIDRSNCALQDFNKNFKKMFHFEAFILPKNNFIKLQIFYDNSIVEVFANDGEKVMTMQIFPGKNEEGIKLFSKNGSAVFENIRLWKMKSIWK